VAVIKHELIPVLLKVRRGELNFRGITDRPVPFFLPVVGEEYDPPVVVFSVVGIVVPQPGRFLIRPAIPKYSAALRIRPSMTAAVFSSKLARLSAKNKADIQVAGAVWHG
jgi:hypothetical protein